MADQLISLGGNLEEPRNAKASDFPAVGPSGSAGESSGAGQLVKMTANQESPRDASLSEFSPQKGKAEGSVVAYKGSVDLQTGMHSC